MNAPPSSALKPPKHEANRPHLHRAKMSAKGKTAFPVAAVSAFSPSGAPMPTQAFDAPTAGG